MRHTPWSEELAGEPRIQSNSFAYNCFAKVGAAEEN